MSKPFQKTSLPMPVLNVYFSNEYDKFNLIERNRVISQRFVEKLIEDTSFSKKYMFCPIVVSASLSIIDGQHRFKACEKLGLPIAFMIDNDAKEIDIRNMNANQNCWKGLNFLDYYSFENEDYQLLKDLREQYGVNMSLLNSALKKICNFKNMAFHYQFRKGEIKITKNREKFIDFINDYVPAIKHARSVKGEQSTRTFFQDATIIGFAHYFLTNRKIYEKARNKMATCSYIFPFCGSYEQARTCVEKLAYHQEKK